MRVVLDTNVVLSGFLWDGQPRVIVDMAVEGRILCFASPEIVAELDRVLRYPRSLKRLARINHVPHDVIGAYEHIAEVVAPVSIAGVVVADDPSDDMFLATAIAAKAEFVVSGDRHLLSLVSYRGIRIVTPSDFLRFVRI